MINHIRLVELLSYSAETGEFHWRVSRTGTAKAGSIAGRVGSRGYRHISLDGRRYAAHRLAWFLTQREWPAEEIDHINGSRDDNRISNLRSVSRAANMRNKGRYRRGSNPRVGVRMGKDGAWHAYIGRAGHLGSFATLNEAVAVRAAAESRLGYHQNHGAR